MITVSLKPRRDGPVRGGHPWVFSGAIADIEGSGPPGCLVHVIAADGRPLGIGYLNPSCSIAIRMLARPSETAEISPAFIRRRLERALALRHHVVPPDTTAYRLVNGEGDFLPGFVVDVYDQFLVVQCLTAGAETLKPVVIEALIDLLSPQGIYEKSEGNVRREEGLVNRAGVVWGEEPPPTLGIQECGYHFQVNIRGGQKTGFFLDQRDNRQLLGTLAAGKRVLNGFSYTGGFGIHAAKHGARCVISTDSAASALQLARKNWQLNGLPADQGTFVRANMFTYMQEIEEKFDIIVLDPPPFIRHRRDVKAGIKGYQEINRQALSHLTQGGYLLTFSCSQHLPARDFVQTVLFAATDAKCAVQIVRHLGPAGDHPVNIAHSEGSYLKGLWLRVGD